MMRQSTRHWMIRAAFLVLGLAPTVATLSWSAYRLSPVHGRIERGRWERLIHSHLGMQATIERVRHPRGGVVLLEQVAVVDPDSRQRVAHARLIELAHTQQGWVVLLSQPEVEEGQFLRLWELLHERVVRGALLTESVQIQAAELTLQDRPSGTTFSDVVCALGRTEAGTSASIAFRVAGFDMPSSAQLQLLRDREQSPPRTRWHLQTGPTPLPCSLFADYCQALRGLGGESRFQGEVWAERDAQGWTGELGGRFLNVNLEQLVETFPHKLSGSAEVVFNHARFRHGRLEQADGYMRGNGGVVGTNLLARFADVFQMQVSDRTPQRGAPYQAYSELGVSFHLGGNGLQLEGTCDAATPGVLMADREGPLVSCPRNEPIPAIALASVLSTQGQVHVPATSETDILLRSLPLPTMGGPAAQVADRPEGALRLK